MKNGKRTNKWIAVRTKLKAEFLAKDVTRCEMCGSDFGLSFAHSKKRRFIQTEADWREVALLCLPDHERVEKLPHDEMHKIITKIIENREIGKAVAQLGY